MPLHFSEAIPEEGEEGFWTGKGLCLPFASDELPISEDLGRRIINWQLRLSPSFDDSPAFENFNNEGLQLAREVKTALLDWTIVYWDRQRYRDAQRLGITDKTYYEYEVALPQVKDEGEPRL